MKLRIFDLDYILLKKNIIVIVRMLIVIDMKGNLHRLIDIPQGLFPLTAISIALQESLDIWPRFNRIHQLYQSRIILQPHPSILCQTLVMQDLIDDKVCVGHVLPENVWSCFRKVVGLEVSFHSL